MIRSLGFQIGAVVAAFVAAGTWLKLHDSKVETKAYNKVVQRSQQEGAARASKSQKAIESARKPGAFDRLRNDPAVCPDCRK